MSLFIPITKVDAAQRLVYGTLTEEVVDKSGEILDYESSKPAFETWTQQFMDASGGKSLGNVRAMHGAIAAGKLTSISYDDEHKRIEGVAKIVDDDAWNKVLEGVYTGFSIGGGYAKRWPDPENPGLMRYTPTLSEVSLVDNPAVPTATFSLIKQDGSVELKCFAGEDAGADGDNYELLEQRLLWLAGQNMSAEVQASIDVLLLYIRSPQEAEKSLMQDTISKLNARIVLLEAQVQPSRGVLKVVSKELDHRTYGEAESPTGAAERAQHLIKQALANPRMV